MDPTASFIIFENSTIGIRISRKAKHLHLIMTPTGLLEVVRPIGCPESAILTFLQEKSKWIRRQLVRQASVVHNNIYRWPTASDNYIPFQGVLVAMRRTIHPDLKTPAISYSPHHQLIDIQTNQAPWDKLLISWLKRTALEKSLLIVSTYGEQLSRWPTQVQVKEYKRCWGLLNPKNVISLHWRLIFAPPMVLNYVVLHEMCHLFHRNHGQSFYRLLKKHMPDYLLQEDWLKKQGFLLNFPITMLEH